MENWFFPKIANPDDIHPDSGLQCFTTLPNWKGGVLERLSWLTDVMVGEAAVEQRRALRMYPRRSFEASFLRTDESRTRIDVFLSSQGAKRILVPLWHEQFYLRGTQTAPGEVKFDRGTLMYREFRKGTLVGITTGKSNEYSVCQIMDANPSSDTIQIANWNWATEWEPGTRIFPLRVGRITDQIQMQGPADRVGVSTIRFELEDADKSFEPSWGYCSPLWQFKVDRGDPVGLTYDRHDYLVDMENGVRHLEDVGERAEIGQSLSLVLYGRERIAAYRAFLYAACGRAVRFYMPTYMSDIQPVSDLEGTTFLAKPIGFTEHMHEPQAARRIIGVTFKDGAPTVFRNINSVAPVYSPTPPHFTVQERYEVDTPLPPIPLHNIDRIMFVAPVRFDQDTFEIDHPTDNGKAIRAKAVVKSSVVDGMPPIECWVTSQPYPVDVLDALRCVQRVSSIRLYEPDTYSTDALRTSNKIVEWVLRQPRVQNSTNEAMTTAFRIDNMILRDLLLKTSLKPEALSPNANIIDGAIKRVLITYPNWPAEAMSADANILNGTLA